MITILVKKRTPEIVGGLYRVNFVTQEREYYEIFKLVIPQFKKINLNILQQLELEENGERVWDCT